MTELKPCPFCGADFMIINVDRLHRSSISCVCGASVSIDSSRCSDQRTIELVDALVEMWNRRADS